MSDEFKFTQNSARAAAAEHLDTVMSRQRREDALAAGATVSEAVKAALGTEEEIQALARVVSVVNLWLALGTLYEMPNPTDEAPDAPVTNQAFLGYIATVQFFVDSAPAKRYSALMSRDELTNGDALEYFLKENEVDDSVIRQRPEYDHDYFQEWKQLPVRPQLALNRADYDAQVAAAEASQASIEEQLRREGKL